MFRRAGAALALGMGLCAVGCSDGEPLSRRPVLAELTLGHGELTPNLLPDVTSYAADLGLLASSVRVRARAEPAGATVEVVGAPNAVADADGSGSRSWLLPLALGRNLVELLVHGPNGETTSYSLRLTRATEPWRHAQVLSDEPPTENAFFGDYLRASETFLYVNASRRGRLYRKRGAEWAFERPSEELVALPLEWMFEAAVTEDALAFVAKPVGGVETLFTFSLDAAGRFVPAGEHVTGTQGTVRLHGDDLVLATAEGLTFLRRSEGQWALVQTLAAPATDIGFALRPTYFDAPGVALSDGVLVVGAPLESSSATGVGGPGAAGCGASDVCASESGAVFVYERDDAGRWAATARLKAPSVAVGLKFGHAAAVDGDWIAVGAPSESSATPGVRADTDASVCTSPVEGRCVPESGAVYLFQKREAGWQPAGMLKASAVRAYDYFGDELVVRDDVVLVGAPGQDSAPGAPLDDASANDSGGLFAFLREGTEFRELGLHKPPPSLDAPFPFPEALALAGSALTAASNAALAEGADGAAVENAGRAYYLYW